MEDLRHAARRARDAGDFEGYRAKLVALGEILNGHPEVVYKLAGADARLGHVEAALRGSVPTPRWGSRAPG